MDNNYYENNINRDVYTNFQAYQTKAITDLDKLIERLDAQGILALSAELHKVKKILANAQVRVIRAYHTYSEENE